jgi:hypothetical protein
VVAFALYLPPGLPQLVGQARVGKRDSAAVVKVIDGYSKPLAAGALQAEVEGGWWADSYEAVAVGGSDWACAYGVYRSERDWWCHV